MATETSGVLSSNTREAPKPFLKWAGGKRAQLPKILPYLSHVSGRYIEPFLGAGAVFFALNPAAPKIGNDSNHQLIEVYEVVRDHIDDLIDELSRNQNTASHYYYIRGLDRGPTFQEMSPVERAARFIFLNKTCFNGLYRVNSRGYFNVPYGSKANADFVSADTLRKASEWLNTRVDGRLTNTLVSGDYKNATAQAKPGDFVYLDPPYDGESKQAMFVDYSQNRFGKEEQIELRNEILRLTELGVAVLLSNSNTEYIRTLFADREKFSINEVSVRRSISSKAASRGTQTELLIANQWARVKSGI